MVLVVLGLLLLSGGSVVFATALLSTPGPVTGIPGVPAGLPLTHCLDGAEAAREIDPHYSRMRGAHSVNSAHRAALIR